MLPVSLIFTSGVASGVNSYAAVLVLGLLGRFGHIAATPPVLERPSVLAADARLRRRSSGGHVTGIPSPQQ